MCINPFRFCSLCNGSNIHAKLKCFIAAAQEESFQPTKDLILALTSYALIRDPTFPLFSQSFVPNGPSPPAPTNMSSIRHTSAPPASNAPPAQSPPAFPGIHIDGDGTAWYLDSNGQWQRCQHYKPLPAAPSPSQAITPSAARLPNFALSSHSSINSRCLWR
ncbi:hypothetical protein MVEN_01134100 [Mycena venus]|uniref:Uncharacterized protein n=1 Tax=Mycena venus TaxID=2733690 RepID=A0A8H6Y5A7_9AGAR|nr:hypothetical protein MVEN_01134100 [Mycena venus]